MSTVVVDDHPEVRRALQRILRLDGHQCRAAGSVVEAQVLIRLAPPEVVLCDLDMPPRSGDELVAWLSDRHPEIAILMVTACDDPATAERVLGLGADGYLVKPFTRNEVVINVAQAHRRRADRRDADARQRSLEGLVSERTAALQHSLAELDEATSHLDHSYEESIWRLAAAAEHRDPETASHLERMSRYSELLARAAGCDESWCHLLRLASPMHDVGKLGIPDHVLLNPGRFTAADRAIMQRHTEIGHQILSGSTSPLVNLAATVALTHHEWWDGSGYPRGLCGQAIPLEGRIVAIADVYDALTTPRRYKAAMTSGAALDTMLAERGTHFDPRLLDLFVDASEATEAVGSEFADA